MATRAPTAIQSPLRSTLRTSPSVPKSESAAAAVDAVVGELLNSAQIIAPPVDAIRLSRQLGLVLAWDQSLAGRARTKRIGGASCVFLRPEPRPERRQWAVAHELGEVMMPRIFDRIGCDPAEIPADQREQVANEFAARLLLPARWFHAAASECGGDLLRLKRRFSTASCELIAMRWLDLPTPTRVSIFDQGRLTRRRSNRPTAELPWTRLEDECWGAVQRSREPSSIEHADGTVRGWPLDEPNWRREIVIMQWRGGDEAA